MSSSHTAVNSSLAWSEGDKELACINSPFGWDNRVGAIFDWYTRQPCKEILSVQHRKDRSTPFFHESLVLQLVDNSLCRIERVGDPDARLDALDQRGSLAQDAAHMFPSSQTEVLDKSSDVLLEVTFPHELDLMDVLATCYAIQQLDETRYNASTATFSAGVI